MPGGDKQDILAGDGACPGWESSVLSAGVCECFVEHRVCVHRQAHECGHSSTHGCGCQQVSMCVTLVSVPLPVLLSCSPPFWAGRVRLTSRSFLPACAPALSLGNGKCSHYLYEEIWKRLQSLLSDLQNHPANWAWTPSPARWPFPNTLAVQTGFYSWLLLLLQAAWRNSPGCAAGRQPRRPALCQAPGEAPSWQPRAFGGN